MLLKPNLRIRFKRFSKSAGNKEKSVAFKYKFDIQGNEGSIFLLIHYIIRYFVKGDQHKDAGSLDEICLEIDKQGKTCTLSWIVDIIKPSASDNEWAKTSVSMAQLLYFSNIQKLPFCIEVAKAKSTEVVAVLRLSYEQLEALLGPLTITYSIRPWETGDVVVKAPANAKASSSSNSHLRLGMIENSKPTSSVRSQYIIRVLAQQKDASAVFLVLMEVCKQLGKSNVAESKPLKRLIAPKKVNLNMHCANEYCEFTMWSLSEEVARAMSITISTDLLEATGELLKTNVYSFSNTGNWEFVTGSSLVEDSGCEPRYTFNAFDELVPYHA